MTKGSDSLGTGSGTGSDWFWAILERADGDRGRLRAELVGLSRADIQRFQNEFVDLSGTLMVEPFASFVEESEDGLTDVAEWVVSQGKATFLSVLESPSTIPHSVEGQGLGILAGVAPQVYEEQFGEALDIY